MRLPEVRPGKAREVSRLAGNGCRTLVLRMPKGTKTVESSKVSNGIPDAIESVCPASDTPMFEYEV